jgi:2-polyprenyl-6-methoxyphenol hydroxylase-like FAD-dependent oxidoreductase
LHMIKAYQQRTPMNKSTPLIVGAGPVGMAAALFLAQEGLKPRIIDSAAHAEKHSRALAVNPRTLEILDSTGITAQMLSLGKPIRGVRFWRGSEPIGELSFESLQHQYPFMLALSQAVTMRLLETRLKNIGIAVERNVELVACRQNSDVVEADVMLEDGLLQTVQCPWMLAADGARSTVRQDLGIDFAGSTFERRWRLVDVPLQTSLPDDFAHVIFLDGEGFLFLIRVIDEPDQGGRDDPVWRIMGNYPDVLSRLEAGQAAGLPIWSSDFQISHRINDRMQQGQIYFAGDSAHIHSPIGARGMNLGIEDAWVFSRLLKSGQVSHYGELRRRIDRRVVRRIELLSRLARGESATARVLRSRALPLMTRAPITRNRLIAMVTGLDHPLNVPVSRERALAHAGRE